jgi:hypothetical protein
MWDDFPAITPTWTPPTHPGDHPHAHWRDRLDADLDRVGYPERLNAIKANPDLIARYFPSTDWAHAIHHLPYQAIRWLYLLHLGYTESQISFAFGYPTTSVRTAINPTVIARHALQARDLTDADLTLITTWLTTNGDTDLADAYLAHAADGHYPNVSDAYRVLAAAHLPA